MKSNPLIPFGATMVLGVVLMVIISFYGASQLGEKGGGAGEAGGVSANAKPKEIFMNAGCVACHGQNLKGKSGPGLLHVGSRLSKDQILKQIKNGGGGMPGGLIKGEAAKKVATWLSEKK